MRTEMVSGCFQLIKPTADVQLNDPPFPGLTFSHAGPLTQANFF